MRNLTLEDVAGLGLKPEQEEYLTREFSREGQIILPHIKDGLVTAVSRFHKGYFLTLQREQRLPAMPEDQLVIGL